MNFIMRWWPRPGVLGCYKYIVKTTHFLSKINCSQIFLLRKYKPVLLNSGGIGFVTKNRVMKDEGTLLNKVPGKVCLRN